jgi:ATP-dependent protease Clp ATPase subunit
MARTPNREAVPKEPIQCSFCGKRAAAVQVLVASRTGTHICERCIEVCKKTADGYVNGTSGLMVRRKLPSEIARDTVELLREMRDEQIITAEDYKSKCLKIIEELTSIREC